jgi:hypothetical protein
LIFNINNNGHTLRVDVLKNGQVSKVAGKWRHGWLSLDGISFATRNRLVLPTQNGWRNYGGSYGSVTYIKARAVCELEGLVKGSAWGKPMVTLPRKCRPPKRLIFNLNNHQHTARVDVLPNGQVVWVAGGQSHGWLSLSGIEFSTENGANVKLLNGWRSYGGSYKSVTSFKQGNMCFLSGLARGNQWSKPIAKLPQECRPSGKLAFNVNNHQHTARLDVMPDGLVRWKAGGRSHGWISLTGISFGVIGFRAGRMHARLAMQNGWRPYGAGYRPPIITLRGPFCMLSGVVKAAKGMRNPLTTLPPTCRPKRRLVFTIDNNDNPLRVDVLPDGTVRKVAGRWKYGWLSLDGILFTTSGAKQQRLLTPQNRWSQYPGGRYAQTSYTKDQSVCQVQGLAKAGRWGKPIVRLPAGCRPPKRLIFNLNNHELSARVDVLTSGQVVWVAGGRRHGWLSLSGIQFALKNGHPLSLLNGWHNYGGSYKTATYFKQGDMCFLSGLLRAGRWGKPMAVLPKQCRPSGRLVFTANNNGKTARVDVLSTGEVVWVAGARDTNGWISISGIVFAVA